MPAEGDSILSWSLGRKLAGPLRLGRRAPRNGEGRHFITLQAIRKDSRPLLFSCFSPGLAACNGAYCPPGSFCRTVPGGSGMETLSGGGNMNRMSEAIA